MGLIQHPSRDRGEVLRRNIEKNTLACSLGEASNRDA